MSSLNVEPHRWSSELEDTSDDEGDHSVNDDSSKLIAIPVPHFSEGTIVSSKPDIAANAISVRIIYNQLEDTSDDSGNHSVNDDYS